MIEIALNNISFSYRTGYNSEFSVFKNINCTLKNGEIVGLIGRNGCGKTTLLNILKGSLSPMVGTISILSKKEGTVAKKQFFIPLISQMVDSNLFPTFTVYENFCIIKNKFCSPLRPYFNKPSHTYCKELLEKAKMNIEDKINEQVRFLSGGQKQAISILFALEYGLPILLMDEPTASLDPFVANNILLLAKNEIKKRNGILLLVSHDLQDIISYTSRILILSNGMLNDMVNTANVNKSQLLNLM